MKVKVSFNESTLFFCNAFLQQNFQFDEAVGFMLSKIFHRQTSTEGCRFILVLGANKLLRKFTSIANTSECMLFRLLQRISNYVGN